MTEATPAAEPLVPTTGRERVRQALQVTEWMLQVIEAPKTLQRWPRKDREAWMAVVGRPRIRAVRRALQTPPEPPEEAPE